MNDPAATARRPQADALNAICPYWTMFPLSFPLGMLATARPGEWVLDPFCGRGTTLYAARKLGLPTVGIDSNEVAAAIAAAKLVSVNPGSVVALAADLLAGDTQAARPDGEFWRWALPRGYLMRFAALRAGLAHREGGAAVALRGVLLGASSS